MEPERKKSKPPSVSPARRVAFDVLERVVSEDAYASALLARRADLSREDQALAHEIVLGVLRHQKALDALIERYTRRRLAKLDRPVLIALRMGLYQLRFLTRIPPSAAVNESVNLVKLARKTSAAAMVNAALRTAIRQPADKPGDEEPDAMERLSTEVSHPRWLLERWVRNFGEAEALPLAMANNRAPRVAFRVNTLRATVEEVMTSLEQAGVRARPSQLCAGAFVLDSGSSAALASIAEAGWIYVQDEASQLVSLLLDARPEHRILDLCAAPGSKTSHLAAITRGRAPIIACDRHWHRLKTLTTTCDRLGLHSVDALALDATDKLPFVDSAPGFDRVLVDAPCTGTGTLRRHPEIKWRLQPADIQRLAELQIVLLARAASQVVAGGRLVYSTCSLEREENETVVERFLASRANFHLIKPAAPADCVTGEGFVRTFPHRHDTDGFFAAVLERKT